MTDSKVPEGTSTGVTPTVVPIQAAPVQATSTVAPAVDTIPAAPGKGKLDAAIESVVKFLAKLLGKPDPITGQPNVTVAPATQAEKQAEKKESLSEKVWSAANKAVEKAATVTTEAVKTTTTTVNQAVEGVKDVQKDIAAQEQGLIQTSQNTPIPNAPEQTTQSLDTLEKSA